MMARFKTLAVMDWRQFRSVNVEFHPQATVIVGANGSGKTSLLNILSQQIGWAPGFVGTSTVDEETGEMRYLSGFKEEETDEGTVARGETIGSLTYDTGDEVDLYAPATTEDATFHVSSPGDRGWLASISPRTDPPTSTNQSIRSPRRFKQAKCCSTSIWPTCGIPTSHAG